jgi:hypothetical protein
MNVFWVEWSVGGGEGRGIGICEFVDDSKSKAQGRLGKISPSFRDRRPPLACPITILHATKPEGPPLKDDLVNDAWKTLWACL